MRLRTKIRDKRTAPGNALDIALVVQLAQRAVRRHSRNAHRSTSSFSDGTRSLGCSSPVEMRSNDQVLELLIAWLDGIHEALPASPASRQIPCAPDRDRCASHRQRAICRRPLRARQAADNPKTQVRRVSSHRCAPRASGRHREHDDVGRRARLDAAVACPHASAPPSRARRTVRCRHGFLGAMQHCATAKQGAVHIRASGAPRKD